MERMAEEKQEVDQTHILIEEDPTSNEMNGDKRKKKKKQQLLEEAVRAEKRGVCYLSRIPPHMDPLKLRQILSQYGEFILHLKILLLACSANGLVDFED